LLAADPLPDPPPSSGRSRPSSTGYWEGAHHPSCERACVTTVSRCQTARRTSISAPGNGSAPGRRPSCPPRNNRGSEAPQSAGADRRTRGRLAVGPVPSAEGTAGQSRRPARLAALHCGGFRGASLHTLGPRLRARATSFFARSYSRAPCAQVLVPVRRSPEAPRGVRLIRPDPRTPLPAPPMESPVDALERAGMRL